MKKIKLSTLKSVLATGLGAFLITGLSGCSNTKDECDNPSMLSQEKLEKCNKNNSSKSYGSSTHSNSSTIPMFMGNSSTKSSGYFSHTSSTSSGG